MAFKCRPYPHAVKIAALILTPTHTPSSSSPQTGAATKRRGDPGPIFGCACKHLSKKH